MRGAGAILGMARRVLTLWAACRRRRSAESV